MCIVGMEVSADGLGCTDQTPTHTGTHTLTGRWVPLKLMPLLLLLLSYLSITGHWGGWALSIAGIEYGVNWASEDYYHSCFSPADALSCFPSYILDLSLSLFSRPLSSHGYDIKCTHREQAFRHQEKESAANTRPTTHASPPLLLPITTANHLGESTRTLQFSTKPAPSPP